MMKTAERGQDKPNIIIQQSKDTDTSGDIIYSGRIVYDQQSSSYSFILKSKKIFGAMTAMGIKANGFIPITIYHN